MNSHRKHRSGWCQIGCTPRAILSVAEVPVGSRAGVSPGPRTACTLRHRRGKRATIKRGIELEVTQRRWVGKQGPEAGGPVILVEGPMDALSIALAGCPAIGRVATDFPTWFGKWVGLRSVYIGWDADSVGEAKITAVADACALYGGKCFYLRPQGAKDANDMLLQYGLEAVREWLKNVGIEARTCKKAPVRKPGSVRIKPRGFCGAF